LREFLVNGLTDYEYNMLLLKRDAEQTRKFVVERAPKTKKLLDKLTDAEVLRMWADLAGHCMKSLVAALRTARQDDSAPYMLVVHTIKGFGLECQADPSNHSALPDDKEVAALQQAAGLAHADPFARFDTHSDEGRYLTERGAKFRAGILAHEALRERNSSTPKPLCDVHFRVGRLHARSARQFNLALEDFTRASQCDPSRADIWSELASQYERLGDQKRASDFFQDALKRDRGFAPALVGLARDALRARPSQRKRAELYLKRALKRDPKLAEAHYQLCKLYQGSRAKARAACKAYLRVSPEGQFAREVKEILQAL